MAIVTKQAGRDSDQQNQHSYDNHKENFLNVTVVVVPLVNAAILRLQEVAVPVVGVAVLGLCTPETLVVRFRQTFDARVVLQTLVVVVVVVVVGIVGIVVVNIRCCAINQVIYPVFLLRVVRLLLLLLLLLLLSLFLYTIHCFY